MNETVQFTNDPDGKRMFRMGGISAFVLVAGYFLSFPIYFWVGDMPPSNVEAQLVYFSDHAAGWWAILGLMVFTDLLYVPNFFALYRALKEVNKKIMQLALERYQQGGVEQLAERSRAAHCHPNQSSEEVIQMLIETKLYQQSWGPKKVLELFAPE